MLDETYPPPCIPDAGSDSGSFFVSGFSTSGISNHCGFSITGASPAGKLFKGSCPSNSRTLFTCDSNPLKPLYTDDMSALIGATIKSKTAVIAPFTKRMTPLRASTNGCNALAGFFMILSNPTNTPPRRMFLKKSIIVSNKPFAGLDTFLTSFSLDFILSVSNLSSLAFFLAVCAASAVFSLCFLSN